MAKVYLGLGSNLNDPLSQIKQALEALKKLPDTVLECCSSFYQTKPVGFSEQPDFWNAVVKLDTTLDPYRLLDELHAIEKAQGRIRTAQKNGPRTLDLDILLYDTLTLKDEALMIPHPRMMDREFVLQPLREIAPLLPCFTRNEDAKTT